MWFIKLNTASYFRRYLLPMVASMEMNDFQISVIPNSVLGIENSLQFAHSN